MFGNLLAFSYSHWQIIFYETWWNDWRQEGNWRDLADIRIQINLVIRIGILDHCSLKFWHCRRFALSEYSLVNAPAIAAADNCYTTCAGFFREAVSAGELQPEHTMTSGWPFVALGLGDRPVVRRLLQQLVNLSDTYVQAIWKIRGISTSR